MDNNGAQTFGQFLKGYFKGLFQMLKHPLALLPTLLISAAWIVLGIVHTRYGESQWLSWANFFTFAQGGLYGGTVGAIGGILGKILIATLLNAMIMPLFVKGCRPFARFGRGFGGFFKSFAFDSLRALSSFLMGMSVALLLYSVFNITQRWQESLVGVTAAILLLRSIGQRGGLIFSFLFSLTKTFTRGKSPSYVGVSRFLSGMVLGMTLAVGLNAFGLKWCIAFAAGALALALLFVWFGKRQRAALTAATVAALLLIPVYAGSPALQSQEELKEAGKRHAAELAPYLEEINRCMADVQNNGGDAAEKRLSEAQNKYYQALSQFAVQDKQTQQMPQEMQDLIKRATDYDGINSKVESLQRQYESAAANNDQREMDRIANEIAKIYMGQASDAMRLKDLAEQYNSQMSSDGVSPAGDVDTGGTGNPFFGGDDGGYDDGGYDNGAGYDGDDGSYGSDPNPFGIGAGHGDLDWKPSSEEGGFRQTVDQAVDQALDGWADEDSREEDEDDVTALEGVGAGVAIGLGAGGAAGAGGALGGGAGGAGGGGGVPDLPDSGGDWEATEPEEREEEDEEGEDKEDETEGGDGGPDGEEEAAKEKKGERTEAPEEAPEESPAEEAPEEDDYDYEKEREERAKEQAAIDQKYKDAYDKDAEKFRTTSDEERINKEVEEDMKKWEEEQHQQEIIDSIKYEAEDMGVATKDENGNDRSIDDILDDMQKKYVKDTLRSNWREWQDTQMEAAQEELDASLNLANAELVDNVSEGTVNVLAEYVPGGDKVKDFHTFTKATMVGATEGYLKEGWKGAAKGGAAGAVEGAIGVGQNHLSDLTKGATGNESVDKLAADLINIQAEGIKTVVHDAARGKSAEEIYNDVQEATIKKTGDVIVGRILGDGLGMNDHDTNAVGELISKGHDDIKWGGNGNPEEDKTLAGNLASGWQNFKDKTAEKMYDLYYGN